MTPRRLLAAALVLAAVPALAQEADPAADAPRPHPEGVETTEDWVAFSTEYAARLRPCRRLSFFWPCEEIPMGCRMTPANKLLRESENKWPT